MQTEAEVEVLNIEINADGVDETKGSISGLAEVLKALKEIGNVAKPKAITPPPGYTKTMNQLIVPVKALNDYEQKGAKGLFNLTGRFTDLAESLSGFTSTKTEGFKSVSGEIARVLDSASKATGLEKVSPALKNLPEILNSYDNVDVTSFKACTSKVSEAIGDLTTGEDIRTLNGRLKRFHKTLDSYGELNTEALENTADLLSRIFPALDGEKNAKSMSRLSTQFNRLREVMNGFNSIQLTGFKNVSREIEKMVESMKKLNDVPNLKDFIASVKKLGKMKGEEQVSKVSPETPDAPELSSKLIQDVGLVDTLKDKFRELKKTILSTMPKSVAMLAWLGDKAKSVIGKLGSGIRKVGTKIKSMIAYRALNSIVQFISKALKEGIMNLYQYSKVSDGVFSKSMDKIASSTLYVKNAFGSLMGALIEKAAPYIEYIMDRIGDCLNGIRKFYAELTGAQSWTKAKKVPIEFAEGAEKLKRAILGFDKLNVLDFGKLEKASKSKTLTGAKTPSKAKYSTMFEEVKVNVDDKGKLSKTRERFRSLKEAIGDCTGELKILGERLFGEMKKETFLESASGAAEGLFRALKGIVSLLNSWKVPELFGTTLTEALQAIVGITNGVKILGSFMAHPSNFSKKYFSMDWAKKHPKEWADMMYISDKFFTKEELINIANGNPYKKRPAEAKYVDLNTRFNKLSGFSASDIIKVHNLQMQHNMSLRDEATLNKINDELEEIIVNRENDIISEFDYYYKQVKDLNINLREFSTVNSLLLQGRKYKTQTPIPDVVKLNDLNTTLPKEMQKALNSSGNAAGKYVKDYRNNGKPVIIYNNVNWSMIDYARNRSNEITGISYA